MSKTFTFFLILVLFSCSNNSHDKTKIEEKPNDLFALDTLLSNYATRIIADQSYLKKGVENKLNIQIANVSSNDIIIYTKTSEATVKLSNSKSEYLINPILTADSVSIHVNIKQDGKIIMIGKVRLKTE